jgi:hypothetical protein
MSQVEYEPTIPAFQRAKTFHALDRAATVIGKCRNYYSICFSSNVTPCSVIDRYQRFGEPAALVFFFWCCAGKYNMCCREGRNGNRYYAFFA